MANELRDRIERNLKDARDNQERLIKDLTEQQQRVTRLESALKMLTPEREHFVTELLDAQVIELGRPF